MKIKNYLGREGSYLVFEQEGLDESLNYGDLIWIGYDNNYDCDVILVSDWINETDLLELAQEGGELFLLLYNNILEYL